MLLDEISHARSLLVGLFASSLRRQLPLVDGAGRALFPEGPRWLVPQTPQRNPPGSMRAGRRSLSSCPSAWPLSCDMPPWESDGWSAFSTISMNDAQGRRGAPQAQPYRYPRHQQVQTRAVRGGCPPCVHHRASRTASIHHGSIPSDRRKLFGPCPSTNSQTYSSVRASALRRVRVRMAGDMLAPS